MSPNDDCNCTGHFGVDAFCLALHGADLHIQASAKAQIESDAQLAKKAFARMQTLVAKPGDTKAEQEAYEELP